MATNGVSSSGSSYSSLLRLSGMASGLDTDSIIKGLMKVEQIPLNKLSQKTQLSQWRSDAYRDITSSLIGMKNDFLSSLKPASNMLSRSLYKKFTSSAIDSATGTASTVVSATSTSDTVPGTHTIIVNKMATADVAQSMTSFTSGAIAFPIDLSNKDFNISINGGAAQNIKFNAGSVYNSVQDLTKDLQSMINAKLGSSGQVGVSYDTSNHLMISTAGSTTSLTLSAGVSDALTSLSIVAGTKTYSGVTKALTGANITSLGNEAADIGALNGKKFNITLDGVTKEITIGNYANMADLAQGLNDAIGFALGAGKVNVVATGYQLTFSTVGNSGSNKITLTSGTDSTSDGLTKLGFSNGDSNRLSTGLTLEKLASKFVTPLNFVGSTTSITSTADITNTSWTGKKFNLTVDGVTSEITFASDPTSVSSLATTLQGLIDQSFGTGKVLVSESPSNRLTFTKGAGTGYFSFTSSASNDALPSMNIATGATTSGQLKFTINSKDFTFNATQTLSSMLNAINSDSTANVKMYYDETSDKFRITSNQLGAGNNISISEDVALGGNFFDGVSGINAASAITTKGSDANVVVDGQAMVRSSNNITVNGINYTILAEKPGVAQNTSFNMDVDTVYSNISKFVDKYNEILEKINGKLSEKYDRDYPPLTDEQRTAMSDDNIKKWEDKAKTGLLRNDSILTKIVGDMRRALSDPINGETSVLADMGITTGSYQEQGKLIIDETKLKNAIKNNPDSVANLFSKQSSTFPAYSRSAPSSQRTTRYNEEGFMQRLSDILDDNTSIFRDNNGKKGALLEKAGLVGDSSEYKNTLFTEIQGYTKEYTDLQARLTDKENSYYKKFTNLETVMQRMNSQSSWLSSQLGK